VARYRKIDIRMWGDREVLRLSRPQPNGQSLWVYLLAGPATGIIPGAYRAREGGLADELGWSLEGFRYAFREVNGDAFRDGSGPGAEKPLAKADWEAGMVWVPNGIKHNAPTAPNVIRSWRDAWDELPECELKREAYRGLRAFVNGMAKGFANAFAEAIPEPSWKPCRKALANQDQDQEQDQEGEGARTHAIPVPPRATRGRSPSTAPAPTEGNEALSQPKSTALSVGNASPNFTAVAEELDDPWDAPVPLKPCWRLWRIWEEVTCGGADKGGDRKPHERALTVTYGSLEKHQPQDPEGLFRTMVEAYVAQWRAQGKRLDLKWFLADFTGWVGVALNGAASHGNHVSRGTQSLGVTSSNRADRKPIPPLPTKPREPEPSEAPK